MFPKKLGRMCFFLRIHDSFISFATCTCYLLWMTSPDATLAQRRVEIPILEQNPKSNWYETHWNTTQTLKFNIHDIHDILKIKYIIKYPFLQRMSFSITFGIHSSWTVRFLLGIMSPFPSATHPLICEGTAPALSCIQKTQAETQKPHPQSCRKNTPWWKDQMTMVNIHQIERQIYQQTSDKNNFWLLSPC